MKRTTIYIIGPFICRGNRWNTQWTEYGKAASIIWFRDTLLITELDSWHIYTYTRKEKQNLKSIVQSPVSRNSCSPDNRDLIKARENPMKRLCPRTWIINKYEHLFTEIQLLRDRGITKTYFLIIFECPSEVLMNNCTTFFSLNNSLTRILCIGGEI
jgi:hypothetical protein